MLSSSCLFGPDVPLIQSASGLHANALTDLPTTILESFLSAAVGLTAHVTSIPAATYTFRIWISGQGFLRKLALQFEFIYSPSLPGHIWPTSTFLSTQ